MIWRGGAEDGEFGASFLGEGGFYGFEDGEGLGGEEDGLLFVTQDFVGEPLVGEGVGFAEVVAEFTGDEDALIVELDGFGDIAEFYIGETEVVEGSAFGKAVALFTGAEQVLFVKLDSFTGFEGRRSEDCWHWIIDQAMKKNINRPRINLRRR